MKTFVAAIGLCTLGGQVSQASVVARQTQSTFGGQDAAGSTAGKQGVLPRIISDDTYFLRRRPALPHNLENESPEQVQHEVERMLARVTEIGDPALVEKYSVELAHVESALADRTSAGTTDTALGREIATVRATLCEQQGFAQHETKDCEEFMHRECETETLSETRHIKAKANSLVTDTQCNHFFLIGAQREHTVSESDQHDVADPSTSGLFGGKKLRPLPVHGYDEFEKGKLVEHTNGTAIGDWQREFGSYSGREDVNTICRKFPDNQWCRLHTHRENKKHKSGASNMLGLSTASVIALMSAASKCSM